MTMLPYPGHCGLYFKLVIRLVPGAKILQTVKSWLIKLIVFWGCSLFDGIAVWDLWVPGDLPQEQLLHSEHLPPVGQLSDVRLGV